MIRWEHVLERHVRGLCPDGEWWIRLDRELVPIGVYKTFDETEKWVPTTDEEKTLAGAKLLAEIQYGLILESRRLAKKEVK